MKYLKSLLRPLPSFFDLCVGGFLAIFLVGGDSNRGLFIVFYSMFLLMISFGMKPKREYKSIPLTLLALWTFLGMFIHSFALFPKSITYSYKIFYLTMEGFIFILFGIVLIRTIVMYSTNPRFIYLLLPFSVLGIIPGLIYVGSSTLLVAVGLSIIIYLLLSGKRLQGIIAMLLGLVLVMWKWSWLSFKFRGRPYAWGQMFVNMFYNPVRYDGGECVDPGVSLSPFIESWLTHNAPWLLHAKGCLASIFGSGFSLYLNSEYKWVVYKGYKYGWVHKQNDYMNLANCLGPIILLPVIWFIVQSLRTIGVRPALILFMMVALTMTAQLTMFSPGKAGVCLMIMALTITDGLRNKEEV